MKTIDFELKKKTEEIYAILRDMRRIRQEMFARERKFLEKKMARILGEYVANYV